LGRLRVLSGREVCSILARHGFVEVRQRGSHILMQKRFEESTITVPIPNHSELKTEDWNPDVDHSGSPNCLVLSSKPNLRLAANPDPNLLDRRMSPFPERHKTYFAVLSVCS
jgi:predicted RNA binding protein YcfA (HicA-like mRNA interferase family)